MFNDKTTCTTESFGFDFSSVYAQRAPSSDPAEHGNHSAYSSNVAILHEDYEPSIDEMVDELSAVTEKALKAIAEVEDDDDGVTAAEVLARGQKARREPRVSRSKAALQEQEESLSIEGILNQVLECAELVVSRGIVWGADRYTKIWKPLQTESQMANFLHGLGIKRYGSSLKWFVQRVSGDPAFRVPGFFETADLWGRVSLADGLLDVRSSTFAERTLSDRVTATLRWSYNEIDCPPNFEQFKDAMRSLAVTENCYLRLQELCGVALHAEPAGRILFFQHGNPRVASVFTKLLSKVWDEDYVTFLGLRDHERSFRTAQALERPIIISGKEGDSTLRDISTVLALVDGDGVNVERKNLDPFDFQSRCIYICSGRSLPSVQKSSMAMLQYYLVRVNLTGDLPDGTSIHDILGMSKEFTMWSLEGLRRFLSNGGRFTHDEESDIPREDASILNFVSEMIVKDPNGKIPSAALYDAYENFCTRSNLSVLSKQRLVSYLKDTFPIESRTVRASWYNKGLPAFGYVGISFSEEYQVLLSDLAADSPDSDEWPHVSDEDEDEADEFTDDDDWSPDFEHCEGLLA